MEISPEERKALEAEWAKGNKSGAVVARQRAVATIVSSAVLGVFMVPAIVLLSPRLMILALFVGIPLGMLVRKKLMPRGQFNRY